VGQTEFMAVVVGGSPAATTLAQAGATRGWGNKAPGGPQQPVQGRSRPHPLLAPYPSGLACQRGLLPVSPALPHSLASCFELPVQAPASRPRPKPGAAPPPRASAPETGQPPGGSRSAPSTRNPTGRWCSGCPPLSGCAQRQLRGLAPLPRFSVPLRPRPWSRWLAPWEVHPFSNVCNLITLLRYICY
jgi:hypothetical protein